MKHSQKQNNAHIWKRKKTNIQRKENGKKCPSCKLKLYWKYTIIT
jgi:hypothetical protein